MEFSEISALIQNAFCRRLARETDFRVELKAIQLPCKVIRLVHLCQITKKYCSYSSLIVFINFINDWTDSSGLHHSRH